MGFFTSIFVHCAGQKAISQGTKNPSRRGVFHFMSLLVIPLKFSGFRACECAFKCGKKLEVVAKIASGESLEVKLPEANGLEIEFHLRIIVLVN